MFRAVAVVFFLFSFFPLHSSAQPKDPGKPLSAAEIFRRSAPAVVEIDCLDEKASKISLGTGFLVNSEGRIATNFHVIAACKAISVKFANGDIYDASMVVDTDIRKDLALIRVKAANTPQLPLGDSDTLEIGDTVYSIGNPSGLQNTLQQGIVNGFRPVAGYNLVQVSASLNPGNSGGPILDDQGAVVAVAAAKVQGAENLGFAVPINYLKGYLETRTEIPFATFASVMGAALAKVKSLDPVGNWSGMLGNGPHPLHIVVHLLRSASGLEGTMDSPDQHAMGLQLTAVSMDQSKLTFRVDSVHGRYTGAMSAQGNKIDGIWDQGNPMPLILERIRPKAIASISPAPPSPRGGQTETAPRILSSPDPTTFSPPPPLGDPLGRLVAPINCPGAAETPSDAGAGLRPGVFRVGGGVSAPSLIGKVEPEYSEQARMAQCQGTVVLRLEVDPDGRPANVRVVRGLGLGLDENAIEAVRKWQFKPGYKDGQPVTVEATVQVSFRVSTPWRVTRLEYTTDAPVKPVPSSLRLPLACKQPGTVSVSFDLSADGTPGNLGILKADHPALGEDAVSSIQSWKFQPARQNGIAVAASAKVDLACANTPAPK